MGHRGQLEPVWRQDTNRARVAGVLGRLRLDGLVHLTDLRGGARRDETEGYTCFLASGSGPPAMALPAALDGDSMPVGIEIMGRPGSDEALVAMMAAAVEAARGPLPGAPVPPANPLLAATGIAGQNSLRLFVGWSAFRSRNGEDLGDLEPERIRALAEGTATGWPGLGLP